MVKEKMVTYNLKMKSGEIRRVTVPDSWNLTYGQIVPGSGGGKYGDQKKAYGLRFYEGAKTTGKTRMVLTDVVEFWPEDIEILEKITETKRKTYGEDAPEGFKNSTVEARVSRWINPVTGDDDNPEDNKFLLSMNGEDGENE